VDKMVPGKGADMAGAGLAALAGGVIERATGESALAGQRAQGPEKARTAQSCHLLGQSALVLWGRSLVSAPHLSLLTARDALELSAAQFRAEGGTHELGNVRQHAHAHALVAEYLKSLSRLVHDVLAMGKPHALGEGVE